MKLAPKPWPWSPGLPPKSWLHDLGHADLPIVWQATLTEDPGIQSQLLSYLSPEEHIRLQRLKRPADQQRFLTGRGIVRILAGSHSGIPPNQVELVYGPQGKPFVKPPPDQASLRFNVSHSGTLVLLAFHPIHEVGVDVEEVRPSREMDEIANRTFPASDYSAWLSFPPDQRAAAFFQMWARHEARVKALGHGIAGPPSPALSARLQCHDLDLPEGYRGAVAVLPAN